MKTISILNHKGGAGKTTTSVNLAGALAATGMHVVLIDCDPQASATQMLQEEEPVYYLPDIFQGELPDVQKLKANQFSLVPNHYEMTHQIPSELSFSQTMKLKGFIDELSASGNYDYCVLDLPPSLGPITNMALMASDFVLIPFIPHSFAIAGVTNILAEIVAIREIKKDLQLIGLMANMVSNEKTCRANLQSAMEEFKELILRPHIMRSTIIQQAQEARRSVFHMNTILATDRVKAAYLGVLEAMAIEMKDHILATAIESQLALFELRILKQAL